MKTFQVFYTNGQSYHTDANGTAKEFEAYLKQDGGRVTFEDSNGKEFHLWIDRVEEVKTSLALTKQQRLDILTDAIETNAIQYWACEYGPINIWRAADLTITRAEFHADNENGEKTFYRVTHANIQTGIDRILKPSFQVREDIRDERILADDNDAESCDVIIQAALFGQIVYG